MFVTKTLRHLASGLKTFLMRFYKIFDRNFLLSNVLKNHFLFNLSLINQASGFYLEIHPAGSSIFAIDIIYVNSSRSTVLCFFQADLSGDQQTLIYHLWQLFLFMSCCCCSYVALEGHSLYNSFIRSRTWGKSFTMLNRTKQIAPRVFLSLSRQNRPHLASLVCNVAPGWKVKPSVLSKAHREYF